MQDMQYKIAMLPKTPTLHVHRQGKCLDLALNNRVVQVLGNCGIRSSIKIGKCLLEVDWAEDTTTLDDAENSLWEVGELGAGSDDMASRAYSSVAEERWDGLEDAINGDDDVGICAGLVVGELEGDCLGGWGCWSSGDGGGEDAEDEGES
jgi:hypothetical protein